MKTRTEYAAMAESLANQANRNINGEHAEMAYGAALAAESLVYATLATVAPAEQQPVPQPEPYIPVSLSARLRELHYEVDGLPSRTGSCIADGADWPCRTMTALYAAETEQAGGDQ